jgi:hypothetical protein
MRRRAKLDFETDKSVVFVPSVSEDAVFKTWIPWTRECETSLENQCPKDLVRVAPSSPIEVPQFSDECPGKGFDVMLRLKNVQNGGIIR